MEEFYYYSAETGGFYVKAIHGDNMPQDVVPLTKAEYDDIMHQHCTQYKEIKPGPDGRPILVDISPEPDAAIEEGYGIPLTYADERRAAYPLITEYLDGVVKGDQEQIDKYIADCLAVKARFPKP